MAKFGSFVRPSPIEGGFVRHQLRKAARNRRAGDGFAGDGLTAGGLLKPMAGRRRMKRHMVKFLHSRISPARPDVLEQLTAP